MKQRENLSRRNEIENAFEHQLASTHAGQPVVDDRDLHPFFASGVDCSGYCSTSAHLSHRKSLRRYSSRGISARHWMQRCFSVRSLRLRGGASSIDEGFNTPLIRPF